eukprot:c3524_g1_i1.p1 GENE.c3524_g1_i1~~c3524_g1_i1.p1  ORF type:complete len:531 (+),score=128.31 c3524_g1_i1:40-1632(+)
MIRGGPAVSTAWRRLSASSAPRLLNSNQRQHVSFTQHLRTKSTEAATIKDYSDIPGPSEVPFLGSLLEVIKEKRGYHVFIENLHKQYGDIVRWTIMGKKNVSITNPDRIKEVYLANQSAPLRAALIPWTDYRIKNNLPLGVAMELSDHSEHSLKEESWRKYRRPIAKLLHPELIAKYVQRVSLVGVDLAKTVSESNQKWVDVAELRKITSAYGFEAINAILMGKSMNVLGKRPEDVDPLSRQLMDAADQMFRATNTMIFEELPWWKIMETKSKRAHDKAWDDIFRIGGEIFRKHNENKDPRFVNDGAVDFFDIMFENESLESSGFDYNETDRTVMGVELIAAGIDTTSNSAQWILFAMAQFPEVQERLAGKLRELMGPEPVAITAKVLADAKLLHYVDEVMRLHPVLPLGARMFNQEFEICGYKLPPMTVINLNNWVATKDARNYQSPAQFDETRTARRECPFGSKTFGAGSRQCPGERFAKMELAVMLGTLLHRFKIELNGQATPPAQAKLLLSPRDDTSARLRFVPRI